MISKDCFVYFQLPNSLEQLTIGHLKWQNSGANTDVGAYVYGKNYLSNKLAIPLDPFQLPLEEREFQNTLNEGLHGPIRDASPDSWGRYVIEKNTPSSEHDPIGYLLNSANDRIGALSFGIGKIPPAPDRRFNKTVDLKKLIRAAHKLEQDLPLDESERALLMAGPSAGGARPKTTVEHQDNLWLAKFPALNDKQNFSKIEFATMMLAKDCGLNAPEVQITKVGTQDVFLIKRFDRKFEPAKQDYYRTHFVSGLTLLNIDERDRQKYSYLDLADNMRRWIKNPRGDLKELFKRIVFNGLVSNTDDHPRNHGYLYTGNSFNLSPVYDIVPKPETGTARYLAMEIGSKGRVFNLENLLSRCDAFDLKKDEAKKIFEGLKAKIAPWHSYYASHGVARSDLKYLEGAFNHWDAL
jgi:serine/threonine-protein kinase HipA